MIHDKYNTMRRRADGGRLDFLFSFVMKIISFVRSFAGVLKRWVCVVFPLIRILVRALLALFSYCFLLVVVCHYLLSGICCLACMFTFLWSLSFRRFLSFSFFLPSSIFSLIFGGGSVFSVLPFPLLACSCSLVSGFHFLAHFPFSIHARKDARPMEKNGRSLSNERGKKRIK